MTNRLILIEGIPGSGKSTIARKVNDYLKGNGIKVHSYNEGDAHPADMAWNAYIPIAEYEELIGENSKYEAFIRENSQFENGHVIVAYTKLDIENDDSKLMQYFEDHEVYDGKVDFDTFKKLHFKRWSQFAEEMNQEKDTVAIFECSFFQNHVNELMGFYLKDANFIRDYLNELIQIVVKLKPKLIYLSQPNIDETINRVAKERVSSDKSKWEDWIDRVIRYVEDSDFGVHNGLKGYNGALKFFEQRKQIELFVLKDLPIEKAIIENVDYNWDHVFDSVIDCLK